MYMLICMFQSTCACVNVCASVWHVCQCVYVPVSYVSVCISVSVCVNGSVFVYKRISAYVYPEYVNVCM